MNLFQSLVPVFDQSVKIIEIFLGAVLVNVILRRFIWIPKKLDTNRTKTVLSLVQNVVSVIVFLLGIFLILSVLNVNITPLLASAGLVGLTIGLGAQTLIRDLIAGIVLITEDAISIGDFVELGKHKGIVRKITLRTITLRDENGALHIIRASQVGDIINYSRQEASVIIDLTFPPNEKIDRIFKIFHEELARISIDKKLSAFASRKPELKGIQEIEDCKVKVRAVLYSSSRNQWKLKREFLYLLKKRLEKEKIELA